MLSSIVVNGLLLAVFAVQHSVMARPGFKARWTRIVPVAVERSTYVLLSSCALALVFWGWRPLPGVVWEVGSDAGRALVWAISAAGWLTVLATTFLISHVDLFGLRQVYLNLRRRPYTHPKFRLVGLYRLVRHPLMLGFLIAFWATPRMTLGYLVFAIATTLYILVALQLEERDLVDAFGDSYRDYQKRVRMLLPLPRKQGS